MRCDSQEAVEHPWLGPLMPLDSWLRVAATPVRSIAPPLPDGPERGGWFRRRPRSERIEPVWSSQQDEPGWAPRATSRSERRTNDAHALTRTLVRFFTAPLPSERPVLAMWWGVGEYDGLAQESAMPMAVTDERTLAWMTRALGGKGFPLQAAPAFEFDSTDWKDQRLIGRHDVCTPFRAHIGVWVARTDAQLFWGMGATRWCLDTVQNTLMRTGWRGSHGWIECETLGHSTEDWHDLIGLAAFDRFAPRCGWANPALNRAWGSQGLPDHHEWDDPTPRAWARAGTSTADHDTLWMAEPLALRAGAAPDASWLKTILDHAEEWDAAHPLLIRRCRQIARVARRTHPDLALWGRWLWSNPAAGYALSRSLSHGWTHRRAFDAVYQESPALGEWLKLRDPWPSTAAVWLSGHAGSDTNLGATTSPHVWTTPASRRWARRQAPAAVRAWLRLEHASDSATVIAWGELLARWNVARLPGWAVRALRDQGDLRMSVVPVLIQELEDLSQPSYEQHLLCQNLKARRVRRPVPQGLRWMLRAWVKDVITRPWGERSGDDPLDLAAWSIAFQRVGSVVPDGHERWTWARWRAWARQDQAWQHWLARNGVEPGGLLIEEDGWCITGLAWPEPGQDLAAAWPERYPVSDGAEGVGLAAGDAPLNHVLNRWDDTDLEAWTVAHAEHGRQTVVLHRQWGGAWGVALERTPPLARGAGQAWAVWRTTLDRLMRATGTGDGLDPQRLDPRLLLPSMDPMSVAALPLALGRVDVNGWSIVPVGRADDLAELGRLMANCVGDHGYDQLMRAGLCRLFVLYGLRLPALVDLRYTASTRRWVVHQVEAHDNGRATLGLSTAAEALAALYSRLCPNGHPALPDTTSPIVAGFDADLNATPMQRLAAEIGEDAMGLGRPADVLAEEPTTRTLLDDLLDEDDLRTAEPVRPLVNASLNPLTGAVDSGRLIEMIVSLMDDSNRCTPTAMTSYEPGRVPRVDAALATLDEPLPTDATWATVTDRLHRSGHDAAARAAQRYAFGPLLPMLDEPEASTPNSDEQPDRSIDDGRATLD